MGMYLLVMLAGAILCALLANSRGRSRIGWAIAGALFPLISLLVLAILAPVPEALPPGREASLQPVKSDPPPRIHGESEQEYAERLARLGFTMARAGS